MESDVFKELEGKIISYTTLDEEKNVIWIHFMDGTLFPIYKCGIPMIPSELPSGSRKNGGL